MENSGNSGRRKPTGGKPSGKSFSSVRSRSSSRKRTDDSRSVGEGRPSRNKPSGKSYSSSPSKSFSRKKFEDNSSGEEGRSSGYRSSGKSFSSGKPGGYSRKRAEDSSSEDGRSSGYKSSGKSFSSGKSKSFSKKRSNDSRPYDDRKQSKSFSKFGNKKRFSNKSFGGYKGNSSEEIRLNRYIANAGVCSRRDADKLISNGLISINGKVVTELGTKVKMSDTVKYAGEKLSNEKNVYILMNKPKNTITTVSDDRSRITVIDLLQGKVKERVYPVGRLDRDTTGLLVLTNDGLLAKKLTHPRFGIKKVYAVEVDKVMKPEQIEKLKNGVTLEDGFIQVDDAYIDPKEPSKRKVIIELHSGKNRIVRRLMENFGLRVKKLDRISFSGLTKNALTRGKWRFLNPKEVGFLMKTSVEK